jgi:hypothetical protein
MVASLIEPARFHEPLDSTDLVIDDAQRAVQPITLAMPRRPHRTR